MMFHRCCGVSVEAKAGIAVPRTPTETTLYARVGVNSGDCERTPIGGGAVLSVCAEGPSPAPVMPWHDAQFAAKSLWPWKVSRGALGRSIAPAVPSAAVKC